MAMLNGGQTDWGRNRGGVRRFGQFALHRDGAELRKSGVTLRLQDQPMEFSAPLKRPGELVTREEQRSAAWPTHEERAPASYPRETGYVQLLRIAGRPLGPLCAA